MQQRQSIGIITRYIARPFSTKRTFSKPLITPKQNEAIERNQDILSSYMVPGKLKKFFKTRPTRSQAILEENVSSTMNRIRKKSSYLVYGLCHSQLKKLMRSRYPPARHSQLPDPVK